MDILDLCKKSSALEIAEELEKHEKLMNSKLEDISKYLELLGIK